MLIIDNDRQAPFGTSADPRINAAHVSGEVRLARDFDAELPQLRAAFDAGTPFRHVLIDSFLADNDARTIAEAFPKPQRLDRVLATLFAARTYSSDMTDVNRQIARLFDKLGSPLFIDWLKAITGIDHLIIDENFIGAGLHQAVRGSSLPIHADHNTHPRDATLYRRLNLLIYMNPVWDASWGGVLELWNGEASAATVTVEPLLNRCIIMEVHDRAFHGYRRLRTPRGIARNAVVAYYYSRQPAPLQQPLPHATIFAEATQTRSERLIQRMRHASLLRILAVKDRFDRIAGLRRKGP